MTPSPRPLTGRKALVCGASRGIGAAVAQTLAAQGATVWALARNSSSLQRQLQGLPPGSGDGHQAIVADLNEPDQLDQIIGPLVARSGPVHILINNSGGPSAGPLLEADTEAFGRALVPHVAAAHTLARILIPGMRDEKYGRIVNIISTSVKQPIRGLGVSNTIRGAMANWAKTLASEVAAHGITVNNVLPGATRTERLTDIIEARADRERRPRDEVERQMLAEIPAGRFADPTETAAAVAFLAGPDAAYITGINLPVDGGRTACL